MTNLSTEAVDIFARTIRSSFPLYTDPEKGNCSSHARSLAEALAKYYQTINSQIRNGGNMPTPQEFIEGFLAHPEKNYLPKEVVYPDGLENGKFSDFVIPPQSRPILESGFKLFSYREVAGYTSYDVFVQSQIPVALAESAHHSSVAARTDYGVALGDSSNGRGQRMYPREMGRVNLYNPFEVNHEAIAQLQEFYDCFDGICEKIIEANGGDRTIFDLDENDFQDFLAQRRQIFRTVVEGLQSGIVSEQIQSLDKQSGQTPRIDLGNSGIVIPEGEFIITSNPPIFGYEVYLGTHNGIMQASEPGAFVLEKPEGVVNLLAVSSGVQIDPAMLQYPPPSVAVGW